MYMVEKEINFLQKMRHGTIQTSEEQEVNWLRVGID